MNQSVEHALPLISVIVPVYKVEKYLNRCIDSIVRQTCGNLEIILVDDGSPDRCGLICDEYAGTDPRIRVIHKTNGGLSDARNAGLDMATGEFIGFVDSDDFIHPDMYSDLLGRMERHGADIGQCSYRSVSEDAVVDPKELDNEKVISNIEALEYIHTPYGVDFVVAWDKLYRRELFDSIRFPKSKIHEDEFTTYKLFYLAGKIVVTDKKYYHYFQSPGSIIRSGFNEKKLHYAEAMEERIAFFREKGLDRFHTLAVKKYAQWLLLFLYMNRKALKGLPAIRRDLRSRYASIEALARRDPAIGRRLSRILRRAPALGPLIGFLLYHKHYKNNFIGRAARRLGLD